MKILVLCGDQWHPPQVARQGLDSLEQSEFMFDYIEDTRNWKPEVMQLYRCVILTKADHVSMNDHASWMTDAVQASFSEYVLRGNGLFAIHSGTALYEHKLVLRTLLGGVFVRHPEQCPVTLNPEQFGLDRGY